MERDELEPGMAVTWLLTLRGGYGYVRHVPATVVRVGRKRITINAEKAVGGSAIVTVSPNHLRPR